MRSAVSEMHEALTKEAIIGAVAQGVGRLGFGAGKFVAKNPIKSLGAGLTAMDVSTTGAKGAQTAAESAARNARQLFSNSGPTF